MTRRAWPVAILLAFALAAAAPAGPGLGPGDAEGDTAGEASGGATGRVAGGGGGAPGIRLVVSSHDGTEQPVFAAWPAPPDRGGGPVPLLVHLHTWSGDVHQAGPRDAFSEEARARGWAFVHPHFRGPNRTPEACGSAAARADVLDAVRFMVDAVAIDARRVYLAGNSGGGHMALMMAAEAPGLFAGVAAAVPPTDLAAWHAFHAPGGRYARDLEGVCGGVPSAGRLERLTWEDAASVDSCYRARSPLAVIHRARGVPIMLSAGVRDGHGGDSVPVSHTLRAFDALAIASGAADRRFGASLIARIDREASIPPRLRWAEPPEADPSGRVLRVLLAREAGSVRLEITDGGHDADIPAMVAWLAERQRPEAGPGSAGSDGAGSDGAGSDGAGPGSGRLRILVLGDSNAAGDRAWPRVLAWLRPEWSITNRSLAGATFGFDNNGRPELNTLARLAASAAASPDGQFTSGTGSDPGSGTDSDLGAGIGGFDAVLVALGTNDAKAVFKDRQAEARASAAALLARLRDARPPAPRAGGPVGEPDGGPAVFVVLPPPMWAGDRAPEKYRGAAARLARLRPALRTLAAGEDRGAGRGAGDGSLRSVGRAIDPGLVVGGGPGDLTDGVHLSPEAQWRVARLVEAALASWAAGD